MNPFDYWARYFREQAVFWAICADNCKRLLYLLEMSK